MIRVIVEGMTNNKGGKESYIINAYKAFDKERYSFTFIAYDDEIAYEDFLIDNGAEIIHVPPRSQGLIRFRHSLNSLFESNNYDVLWSHKTTLSSCEALEIAKKHNVPLRIIHSHSSSNMGGKLTFIFHQINKHRITKLANEYFACSDTAGRWFYGNKECKLIKNGIDVEKFRFNPSIRNRVREELGVSDCFVIGHVGRFSIEKNHMKLIDVFSELSKSYDRTCLLLCGDGEQRENIETHIRERAVGEKTILMGVINNVNEVLQAMDIIVMPSLFEGLPFALLEAQAAGLQCIVSETVSKESDILGWNVYLPLSLDDNAWAKVILNQNKMNRQSAADVLKAKGYDINDCVEQVDRIITEHI